MYKVKVISYFNAAHFLKGYKGKCENLHGHNWKVEIVVSSPKLNSLGMVMDFSQLKKKLNSILKNLDHTLINKVPGFEKINPSSEYIAQYIFNHLKGKISLRGCRLEEVIVWETENSCAIYHRP